MSGRPSRKSAEIGLFRPFSAFFALFRRGRKRRKKALFLRFPRISLNPHLLNPHLRHPKERSIFCVFGCDAFSGALWRPLNDGTTQTFLQVARRLDLNCKSNQRRATRERLALPIAVLLLAIPKESFKAIF